MLAGASKIIAVDIDDRELATARSLGATHTVNSKSDDPVEGIRALTDGNGADVVGRGGRPPETYEQAFYARDLAGTVCWSASSRRPCAWRSLRSSTSSRAAR